MPEPDAEALERRLEAVERAVTRDDHTPSALGATPDEELTARLDTLEERVDELDAALQAVRGFLGGVDAVNESVEARADAAVAAVERLEQRLDETDAGSNGPARSGRASKTEKRGREVESPTDTAERSLGERLGDRW